MAEEYELVHAYCACHACNVRRGLETLADPSKPQELKERVLLLLQDIAKQLPHG